MPVFKLIIRSLTGSLSLVFFWIGYAIDTYSGLICATDSRIGKFSSVLVDICVALEEFRFVHVRELPPLSVKLFHCLLASVQLLKL